MKNKVLIPILIFMVFFFPIRAQNLVPNYSFENKIQCPENFDEFETYVAIWTGGGGPTYFTQCAGVNIHLTC